MDAPKADNRALLLLVYTLALDHKTTLKATIAQVAAQNKGNASALTTAYYRNTPKGPQHGNRLLTDREGDTLV